MLGAGYTNIHTKNDLVPVLIVILMVEAEMETDNLKYDMINVVIR